MEEMSAKERNAVWSNPRKDSLSVGALLWKGSPDATKVQRIGVLIFGVTFISVGIANALLGRENGASVQVFFGVLLALVGTKVTLSAFRRRRKSIN
jgi:uncharacterized membrane protein HdeD (DUF308 family)